jgi:glycosyltransferase involved in cell wall biosynthesis
MEMDKNPFFSVITVAYNSDKTIEQTILSVLNQSFTDYEYIIIDGASTDGTLNIIKSYESKFEGKLKFSSGKDNGIYDAMNKGIGLARGKFVGIINSDDWYEIDALKKIYDQYQENIDVDLIYGTLRIIRNDYEYGIERVNYNFLKDKMIPHPTTFIRREVYIKEGTYSEKYKYAADYDYVLKLFEKSYKFTFTNEIISNYREGGATHTNKKAALESFDVKYEHGLINKKQKLINICKIELKSLFRTS